MLEKDIISYKKCENEDEKMDFLSDYDNNPSDEFIKFLLNEFDNEEDEFLQVEIIKFIATHGQKSNEIKDIFLDKMLLNNELDDFISALLRLFYIKRDKGANVYLDALKKHGIDFG